MGHFEIKAKDGLARLGKLTTRHGTVKTPLLMPVVHPGKSTISPQELVDHFGFQMVITNSYIIRSHDHFRDIAVSEGVHKLLNFNGPIMTDSGTFQMYFHSLPDQEIDPLEIVEFQKQIGSDIGTILDVFSDPNVGRTKVEEDVRVSLERAKISVDKKGEMMLAGTVQGGSFPDLRETSAKALAVLDFDIHPIGGIVPFMERYRYTDIVHAALAAKKHLPPDRPVHLFGCGHPMFFAQAALLGCDLFDSAAYAKFAESGRMLLSSGTVHLDQLTELPCDCPVCMSTSANELKVLEKSEKVTQLMKHNLYVTAAEMRRVRQAINDGKLFELAANRARNHPTLLEAFDAMMTYEEMLVANDAIGKTASIFYTGPETSLRPSVVQFYRRLMERYPYRNTRTVLIVPDNAGRPFAESATVIIDEVKKRTSEDLLVIFLTPIGPIPWELEHVHPAQQCLFPNKIDEPTLELAKKRFIGFLSSVTYKRLIWFNRDVPTNMIFNSISDTSKTTKMESASEIIDSLEITKEKAPEWTKRKLRAVLNLQWGEQVSSLVDLDGLNMTISKSTGKIRHVKQGNEILLTLVPTTGLFTPTYQGGIHLLKQGIESQYIVTIEDEVSEFVSAGKSALAKFIVKVRPNLLAGEEVLVVDGSGSLLGVGKALLSGTEMIAFQRGVAVNIRHAKTN
ncbi:MAG: tRNA guanosine(15) transglycosylase TgtA [Candidatus Thorarchaeota archaeon]